MFDIPKTDKKAWNSIQSKPIQTKINTADLLLIINCKVTMEETITTNELGTKAKSKNRIYRLLVTEGKVFLPPQNEVSHYYLSDIISGKLKTSNLL